MRRLLAVCLCAAALAPLAAFAQSRDEVRIKDLGRVDGWRENQLVGYGIVTGLAGTGDSARSRATRQSLSNLLSQFELYVPNDQILSRNVAAVMVIAKLPAFSTSGDKLDVTISSIGDARSLLGGTLLLTPLKGPDGIVHALAQGPLSVGGYKYDLNGNVVQKNHPTVGVIPDGATVEVAVATNVLKDNNQLSFILAEPDYTTATRIAETVNARLGQGSIARAADASRVNITVPPGERDRLPDFLTRIENVSVEPDHRAKVVVNERTGSVISGGNVRISSVTVSHGELKVSITTDYLVSQPFLVRGTPGARTEVVPQTRINVQETESGGVVEASDTVADLVRALNKIRTHPRDMISILQGIKAAGALHAELIIQ
jgi:flagellar P-ring protein precursor FlgI